MTTADPLYLRARQSVLHRRDASIASLQRALRIGYQHATALRDAMLGDILECNDGNWRIRQDIDMRHDPLLQDKLAQAAEWIRATPCMVIAAGAGMGIDSGLPDFRGDNGFWRAYPALGQARLRFEDIASARAFEERPATAWGFYGHRLNLYRATTPHAGFGLLHGWAERMAQGCFVFTSNVDGQFQKAGFALARVYECHGSLHRLQCLANCSGEIWASMDFQPEVNETACALVNAPPRCPRCGGLARPNVLMFDDWQWNHTRSQQQRMLLDMWLDRARAAPLVIEIGAGRAIATVRNFSQRMKQRGSQLIRINLHEANVHNPHDIEIALGAREALERIASHLQGV